MIHLFIIIIAAGLYFFFIFPTQWLKVERVHYPSGLGIRVLQISDLHVEKLRISAKRLQQVIQKEKPDYIFLTGDFTEHRRYFTKVKRYAEAITAVGVPVYAVLGNHDHRLNTIEKKQLVQILQHTAIEVMRNRSISLKRQDSPSFQIVGIDDFCSRKSRVDDAFRHIDPTRPVLVLTHDPNLVLHMKRDYTYLMAGHFHGMQFHVPFLFRFIKKGRLAASGIYKGLHIGSCGPFYISKGIGQAGINARFLIRSEITMHEL